MTKRLPDFRFERQIRRAGYQSIIGVDEVGRGALAGPVVAAAVCLCSSEFFRARALRMTAREKYSASPRFWETLGINDSKKLSPKKRQELDKIIRRNAVAWGIGEAGVAYINKYGIVKATAKAMRQAVSAAHFLPPASFKRPLESGRSRFLLVDAFHVKYVPGVGLKNQQAIIKGDEKSLSIAAASIIAKVHRDKLMTKLHQKHPHYQWRKNKGYGTPEHLAALKKYGPCRLHRTWFMLNIWP